MHELHLMAQVVKAVEAELEDAPSARPIVVRLKVNALSHLLADDRATLQTIFALAARGTVAEGATLEIIPVSGDSWCPRCLPAAGQAGGTCAPITGPDEICSTCGGRMVAGQEVPEVMVHEVVVEE